MTAAKTPYTYWQVDWDSMPWKMECDYVRVYQADPNVPPCFCPIRDIISSG